MQGLYLAFAIYIDFTKGWPGFLPINAISVSVKIFLSQFGDTQLVLRFSHQGIGKDGCAWSDLSEVILSNNWGIKLFSY